MRRKKEPGILEAAKGRFEAYIAQQGHARQEVGKTDLATGFMEQEPQLTRKLGAHAVIHLLKKWAETILAGSFANESARKLHPQMALPLMLSGIDLPAFFSFRNGVNQVRWVANYKVVGWQMKSHLDIGEANVAAVTKCHEDDKALYRACEPLFAANPELTLKEALEMLRNRDADAA